MANVIFDLSGKVAIVTGGNGGIGLGISRGLAEAGADIVVAARDKGKTEDAVSLLRGLGSNAVGVATEDEHHAPVTVVGPGAAVLGDTSTELRHDQ